MKKTVNVLCTLALMSALCAGCRGGDAPTPDPPPKEPQVVSHYYYGAEKIDLKVRKDLVVVKTASEAEAKALSKLDIFGPEDWLAYAMYFWRFTSIDPEKTTIEDVRKLPGVLSAAYGMENELGIPCWVTNKIFVQPARGTSIEKVVDEAELTVYVKDTELFNPYSGIYLLTLDLNLEHILWASCELFETGLCQYTEPNLYGGIESTK